MISMSKEYILNFRLKNLKKVQISVEFYSIKRTITNYKRDDFFHDRYSKVSPIVYQFVICFQSDTEEVPTAI